MDIGNFRKIVPYLNRVESVVLEGWGESLLHKNLVECIGLIKKEGTQVGFVTSGIGLDEAYITDLSMPVSILSAFLWPGQPLGHIRQSG